MLKTITVTIEIAPDRELRITLPADTPLGPAEVVVVVSPTERRSERTFSDLLSSEFFGMWRDRDDIKDSAEFSRQHYSEAWSRPQ
jgi:hypothetical protein